MHIHVRVRAASADRETVLSVVGLGPPAVENRKIEPAVEHDFLSARAARFQRPPRIVEPYVDALHKMAADVDVVVFDENKFVAELRVAHHLRDLLQHALARLIERMRFAGKNKLHRPLRIVDHRSEALDVGKN